MSPICTTNRFGLVIRTNLGPLVVPTLTRWKLIGPRENSIGASVVGVELGVGVRVAIEVGVALAVGTLVGISVRVGVGNRVATEVGVGLEVGVDVSAGVAVGDDKFGATTMRATNDVTFAACAMPPPFAG